MRVLFDQATPVPIRTFLIGHTVRTAAQEHWDTLQNGDLLTVAERAGFEVFLTTDKNMQYQQNMAGRTIAVVVIGLQQWPALQPHVALVVAAVNAATPGSFTTESQHFSHQAYRSPVYPPPSPGRLSAPPRPDVHARESRAPVADGYTAAWS